MNFEIVHVSLTPMLLLLLNRKITKREMSNGSKLVVIQFVRLVDVVRLGKVGRHFVRLGLAR